uniref:Uncharacterized protein n=1 Tax=viral metagenome TaxID=1070528 RepID=A0A6C0KXH6_9ZZZZ
MSSFSTIITHIIIFIHMKLLISFIKKCLNQFSTLIQVYFLFITNFIIEII